MATALDSILAIVPFKKRLNPLGASSTATFNSQSPANVLTVPAYQEHLTDIFTSRSASNSMDLMKQLTKHDPEVSSTVNSYLTMADTQMRAVAKTIDGEIDLDYTRKIYTVLLRLTRQIDYTLGFQFKESLRQTNSNLRTMLLMSGAMSAELIVDKNQTFDKLRLIDPTSIRWFEQKVGEPKPSQNVSGRSEPVPLDSPTFFMSFYRRDPTTYYSYSPMVSAINSIAARTQVVNDLYRIMNMTGYPRMEIRVMEEVIRERAPADVKSDAARLRAYVNSEIQALASQFSNLRVDQAIAHTDSVEMKILNEKNPGMSIDVSKIIDMFNSLNQAALKTMATTLGRGENGANTGSVEARLAALYADQLNVPLIELWEKLLSFILHQDGFQGFVEVEFSPSELRPLTELEPQLAMKASRLRQDLSDGIISDVEYHLAMYGRLPPPTATPLSGTGFLTPGPSTAPNPADVSPNADPLGRSISPDQSKQTKANPKKVAPKA
jgi:hypothetical protein